MRGVNVKAIPFTFINDKERKSCAVRFVCLFLLLLLLLFGFSNNDVSGWVYEIVSEFPLWARACICNVSVKAQIDSLEWNTENSGSQQYESVTLVPHWLKSQTTNSRCKTNLDGDHIFMPYSFSDGRIYVFLMGMLQLSRRSEVVINSPWKLVFLQLVYMSPRFWWLRDKENRIRHFRS